jgi:SAM-dependent methyltransferase
MSDPRLYAEPRLITDVRDCGFYHTMEIPGHGLVEGQWDLRSGIDRYLGNVSFAGKRVLDVGTASGFLTFHVERAGADVVSYDLSPDDPWDVVPFAGTDLAAYAAERRAAIQKLNNGYWLCHRAVGSRAHLVHGTLYAMPSELGPVDVAILGSILLHVRDPFAALQNVAARTTETIVVTDLMPRGAWLASWLGSVGRPAMTFLPRMRTRAPKDTWWILSPQLIVAFLAVLGFEDTTVTTHWQLFDGRKRLLYTVVGRRTQPAPRLEPA